MPPCNEASTDKKLPPTRIRRNVRPQPCAPCCGGSAAIFPSRCVTAVYTTTDQPCLLCMAINTGGLEIASRLEKRRRHVSRPFGTSRCRLRSSPCHPPPNPHLLIVISSYKACEEFRPYVCTHLGTLYAKRHGTARHWIETRCSWPSACTGLPTGLGLGGRVGCAARFMECSTIVPCLHVQTTAFPRLACELPAFLVVLIAMRLPVFIARRPSIKIHPSDKLRPRAQTSSPVS